MVGVLGVSLDEEVLPPECKVFEASRIRDIVDEHARLSSSVERDAQTLISLLAGRVPNLGTQRY